MMVIIIFDWLSLWKTLSYAEHRVLIVVDWDGGVSRIGKNPLWLDSWAASRQGVNWCDFQDSNLVGCLQSPKNVLPFLLLIKRWADVWPGLLAPTSSVCCSCRRRREVCSGITPYKPWPLSWFLVPDHGTDSPGLLSWAGAYGSHNAHFVPLRWHLSLYWPPSPLSPRPIS